MCENFNKMDQRVSIMEAQLTLLNNETEELRSCIEILTSLLEEMTKRHDCKCNHNKSGHEKPYRQFETDGIVYYISR